jgi:hypothetical protein
MIQSLAALVVVAAVAGWLAVRALRLLLRKGRGCAGCSLARIGNS